MRNKQDRKGELGRYAAPEEYKEKKARLVNKRFELQAKGSRDGEWLERYKNLITLAHQASYIAAEANFEAQRDFLRRAVSNLKLFNKTLIISYTSAFKIHAELHGEDMGSLSYEPRGNLSNLQMTLDASITSIYIRFCNSER